MDSYFDRCLNGPPFDPDEDQKYEFVRLLTFNKVWPKSSVAYPLRLAQAGFYYTGKEDQVTCSWCGITKGSWQNGDEPWFIHLTLSPDCPFFNSDENIPLSTIYPEHIGLGLDQTWTAESCTPESLSEKITNQPAGATVIETPVNKTRRLRAGRATTTEGAVDRQLISGELSVSKEEPKNRNIADSMAGGLSSNTSLTSGKGLDIEPSLGSGAEALRFERKRLETFKNWPRTANVPASELARCGFYYTGSGDRVQCIFCKGILRNWDEGDRPHIEHMKHFPKCPLVLGLQIGNVPLPLDVPHPSNQAEPHTSVPNTVSTANMASLGVMTEKPKNAGYAVLAQRLSSFKGWPASKYQTPTMLAEAGFWYAGFGDNVKCFFCDGGLRNWEPGDEPWIEHAKWFPQCQFLKQNKGAEFVQLVQQGKVPEKSILDQVQQLRKAAIQPQALRAGTVEEREVRARMDRDHVRVVEKMGISRNIIERAIRRQLNEQGDDFPSTQALLEAIFRLQEEEQTTKSPGSGEIGSQSSSSNEPLSNGPNLSSIESEKELEPEAVKDPELHEKKQLHVKPSSAQGDESPEEIRREILELKEQRLCKICMVEEANMVFLPCAHLVSCASCAPALPFCPICRAEIKGSVRAYLA